MGCGDQNSEVRKAAEEVWHMSNKQCSRFKCLFSKETSGLILDAGGNRMRFPTSGEISESER